LERSSLLDRSAIILAGGSSSSFKEDKGLIELDNEPLIRYVYKAVRGLVDEVVIVTDSKERADQYAQVLPDTVKFVLDAGNVKGPLIGALTGFENAQGKYSILLPFDAPLVSKEVIVLLFDCGVGKTAAIPRNPDNEIEPLCAVYQTKLVLETARRVADEGKVDLYSMVEQLRGVRFISTMVIEQIDPQLRSFFNVNTPLELRRAAVMLQPNKQKTSKH
jgi:molybdopterin-guanine dinucleotide biosynthesis protein A